MTVRRANQILARLGSKAADLNALYRPQSEQDTCADGETCGVRTLVGWNSKWDTICPASPRIGLVDTHLQLDHPALSGQKIEVIDVMPKGRKPSSLSHGTGIAALLAGARGSNAQGLLPDAELVVATPFYSTGAGDRAEAADIIRAIDAVVARGPDVLNLSLAGPPNAALAAVLERVVAKGIPVVAAAGNDGSRSKPLYPAGYDTTLAVTAVASDLKIFRRAPRGGHIDFAAPGVEVRLADGKGGVTRSSGTSFAAPFLSASIAMLRDRQPDRPVDSIVAELAGNARDLGRPGKDSAFGWGLINAAHLCREASSGSFEPAGQ
jgi:subtilisin family serine protease